MTKIPSFHCNSMVLSTFLKMFVHQADIRSPIPWLLTKFLYLLVRLGV